MRISGGTRLPQSACGQQPDPHRRQEGRRGLLPDFAVGQGFLQFGDARVGDLSIIDNKPSQPGQPLEMRQPRVVDLRASEVERL